ncbi:MAG: hypothetical protein Q9161_005831 [Pseudevernia consocians]
MPEPPPIPSPSPSPPEDIAAAMGFASFGAKPNPPKKKRKLADPHSEGSGSNNTPLGVRTRTSGAQPAREEQARARGQSPSAGMKARGRLQGPGQRSGHSEPRGANRTLSHGLPDPDPLAAAALDETAAMLLESGMMPRYLDWDEGFAEGGPHGGRKGQEQGRVAGQDPDHLAAAALDETAAMLLETGMMPRYLDWDEGFAEGGPHGGRDGQEQGRVAGQVGGGGGGGDEMRRSQGKRWDGTWDWQALRRGVVMDERGDVAFYDGSFVEDPWRGLGGGRGEGR